MRADEQETPLVTVAAGLVASERGGMVVVVVAVELAVETAP